MSFYNKIFDILCFLLVNTSVCLMGWKTGEPCLFASYHHNIHFCTSKPWEQKWQHTVADKQFKPIPPGEFVSLTPLHQQRIRLQLRTAILTPFPVAMCLAVSSEKGRTIISAGWGQFGDLSESMMIFTN